MLKYFFTLCVLFALPPTTLLAQSDCVVLLHGLARTSGSMQSLEKTLESKGYAVANIDYPSRKKTIDKLATEAVTAGIKSCNAVKTNQIHFVTHSLGGILVRYFLTHNEIVNLGRVVMLAPPNQGSEVVDNWQDVPGYKLLNGPAGLQLGTDSSSVPLSLGPVDFPLGVIAGNTTINPLLSLSLPNPDDGKVSVEKTKVEGMTDFIVMPYSHPFIMKRKNVINQVIYFLENGHFRHPQSSPK